jgi:hypothetical protein
MPLPPDRRILVQFPLKDPALVGHATANRSEHYCLFEESSDEKHKIFPQP